MSLNKTNTPLEDPSGRDSPPLEKFDVEHVEVLDADGNAVNTFMTDEQSRAVCRKIDRHILPLLVWAYFLQILDKSVVGYGSIFGLQEDAGLHGDQYSVLGSMGYIAQLAWQPFSAYLIVKVPPRILAPTLVFSWGCAMLGLAASTDYHSLLACRFLLGVFEAGCLPLFTCMTSVWWRRKEQPLRLALWYGTNGLASVLGSLLAYGVSFINGSLYTYQILFLIVGLVTVLTGPLLYWRLDNSPADARFLTEEERVWACERVRANQTGMAGNYKWNLSQMFEAFWSPVTWLYLAMAFAVNMGASVTVVMGPLIVKGFGFNSRKAILLNMPFGALQVACIFFACLVATRFRVKSVVFICLALPVIAGAAILYSLDRSKKNQAPNLVGYYFLSFLYAMNPIILSWMAGNVAGTTKKAVSTSLYKAADSAGNIVGPLLFKAAQKPLYKDGIRATMGVFIAAAGSAAILVGVLLLANKRKERQRVALGKPAKVHDRSMAERYVAGSGEENEADLRASELSDFKNPMFTYVY